MIVEDEMVVSMMISDMLEELGYNVIEPVSNYDDAIISLKNSKPDIVLLDIQLEGSKSGIDLAYYIKSKLNLPFIFLTSQSDSRTVESAKILNPNAYLLKPFTKDDLYTSIELAIHNFGNIIFQEDSSDLKNVIIKDAFFVKSNNLFHKVKFTEKNYKKSDHVYVEIYTKNRDVHLIRSSMNDFCESIPANFFKVHRSYTVNLDHLDSINSLYVLIENHKIPIGVNYRQQLLQQISIK